MRLSRSRARFSVVGSCRQCGVRFGTRPENLTDTLASLHAHEGVCPGGSRNFDVVFPLGPVREIRVVRGSA
jgi:hypothetical protein